MKTNLFNKCLKLIIAVTIISPVWSCNSYLAIDPPTGQVSTTLVFNNDDAANSAVTGIYSRMMTDGFPNGFLSCLTGLSADEFLNYSLTNLPYYNNALTPTENNVFWNGPYQYIYTTNAILEGLTKGQNLSPAVKKQIEGEARFIRAFCYFYLTNLFGEIPLHLNTDYRVNNSATKRPQTEIYQQIITDLKASQDLLGDSYYTTERVRPNKWAAKAMLARVYLYTKDWTAAEKMATSILENKAYFSLKEDLNQVFLKNSTEAIWQLMPNTPGKNTNDAALFIINGQPTQISLTESLINAFGPGDKRKTSWVGVTSNLTTTYYYPYKYKAGNQSNLDEYSMVLRLAEQYLIRAEARINLNQIEAGIEDINVLRKRARPLPDETNLNPIPALSAQMNKTQALHALAKERRIELFSEWGHRWLDLKRTDEADAVLSVIKGSNWQKTDVLYPIPQSEIIANPKIKQNDGY